MHNSRVLLLLFRICLYMRSTRLAIAPLVVLAQQSAPEPQVAPISRPRAIGPIPSECLGMHQACAVWLQCGRSLHRSLLRPKMAAKAAIHEQANHPRQ